MNAINKGSINMMAILLVSALGYNMAKGMQGDGIASSIVSMTCYLAIAPAVQTLSKTYSWQENIKSVEIGVKDIASGGLACNKLDANGMFVAMILTIIVTEIFVRLSFNDKLKITLPKGVPPAVANSFTVLIPEIITVIVVVAVGIYINRIFKQDIWQIITKFVSTPLTSVADSLGSAFIIYFLINFLWVFGLHGANIVGAVTSPILSPLGTESTQAFEAGLPVPNTINDASITLLGDLVLVGV